MKQEDKTKEELIEEIGLLQKRLTAAMRLDNGSNELESLLDIYPEGVYIVNQQYDIEYLNPVLKKEFGEIQNRKCFEYFHNRKESCPWCQNDKVFLRETVRWEWTSEKNKKTYDLIDIPLIRKDGSISKLEIFHDITERKHAEAEIMNSHKLLQRIIDLLPVRIFWKDKNLRYLGCNEIFAKDSGSIRPEELIGKDDFQMGWKDQAEAYQADDQEVIKTRKSKLGIEEPQTTPKGGKIWLKTNKVPLIDAEGNEIGVLGTYEDVTKRKNMEEELQKHLQELETFYKVSLDREERIIELKKEVADLKEQLKK